MTETMLTITLPPAPARTYDIVIGEGLLQNLGKLLSERLSPKRCIIITETNVAPLYLKQAENSLKEAGHTLLPSLIVPAGEGSKSMGCYADLMSRLIQSHADRKTLIVALGGGVIGDLAGFAAATFMRGTDFIQVPTTLLAQTDSSVGGKTAIDTQEGKNLIGAFHQPRLVVTDTRTLDTLPLRDVTAGYGEVVKYGLIMDKDFFAWCRTNATDLLAGNPAARAYAVHKSCEAKARIVEADERESGQRALLNMGHTFGHALEAAVGFDPERLLHGEAVAIGTLMAFRLSVKLGLCPAADADEVEAHFKAVGLPTTLPALPPETTIDTLMDAMAVDKKAEDGTLTLILTKGIGTAFVAKNFAAAPIREMWAERGVPPAARPKNG